MSRLCNVVDMFCLALGMVLLAFHAIALLAVETRSVAPLLIVAFDGLRADYLTTYELPNFHRLSEGGATATSGIISTFPTLTFPAFYTIVTGLHPESHGIVNNVMYDTEFRELFQYNINTESKWFEGAEPIWITARNQGLATAAAYWPASTVIFGGTTATYSHEYSEKTEPPFEERVDEAIEWLAANVSFVALYFPQPDHAGHEMGASSDYVGTVMRRLDNNVGYLLDKLQYNRLLERINLIVVSDHGMANVTIDEDHFFCLESVLSKQGYTALPEVGPMINILPVEGKPKEMLEKLKNAHPNITVYHKRDIPERFHYRASKRIHPIVALADEGYIICRQKNTLEKLQKEVLQGVFGTHGYDNWLPSMRPLFIARGANLRPATLEPFESVDIYPLMCRLLNIRMKPNNGSLGTTHAIFKDNLKT